MNDDPEREALFYIEGPDERGCAWMHGTSSRDPWSQNLGPADKVAEALSQWLGSIDHDERGPSASHTCTAEEADVLRMIKVWPGVPAIVTCSPEGGWSVGTDPSEIAKRSAKGVQVS